MASYRVFLTGSTGYIGGDVLYALYNTHPEWNFHVLARNDEKATQIQVRFPRVHIIRGDLDATEIIQDQVRKADLIYHLADSDHAECVQAIISALKDNSPSTSAHQPSFIHLSGTGVLISEDISSNSFGIQRNKIYDDWAGINQVTSLPDHAPHRAVDKLVLDSTSDSSSFQTAIVCPPAIYGLGRGPGNQRRSQLYFLARSLLQSGKGPVIDPGTNIWNAVHIHDLSQLFVQLGEAAYSREARVSWNREGYYFVESEEFRWGEVQREVVDIGYEKRLISEREIETLTPEEVGKVSSLALHLWGTNSRCRAIRARRLLGWEPQMPRLRDSLAGIVEVEAKELSMERLDK